jgi:hypothetical protein
MLDYADKDAAEFDPPGADVVYARCLETCRRLGVEPTTPERVRELTSEFKQVLTGADSGAKATH